MKLDKYFKLKNDLETFNFEKNFNSLSRTLYYFSFLGNIFLILFSYFFIKDVTNSIPTLFTGQGLFFSIFIVLFMTGYELFKRFSFQQLTGTILRLRKVTINIVLGILVSLTLVSGSFYLSLNGAHRLIDTKDIVLTTVDSSVNKQTDSLSKYYDKEIEFYRTQPSRTRADRQYRDSIVAVLQTTKDTKIKEAESKISGKSTDKLNKVQENSTAFAIMVFFLELIILIGVAFDAYYVWTSYDEMKQILNTPKYKQLEIHLRLLKLYFQNGRKKEQDPVMSRSKLISLAASSKIPCNQKDINGFIALCSELEITSGNRRNKVYNMNYDKAKGLIENQDI
jgi:small-conductance mechanosensitive channel